jgi:hypothetical protein
MVFPMDGTQHDAAGPAGYTYGVVLVRGDSAAVLAALREVRFSGWLSRPQDGGWLVAVAASGDRAVASGRRGVVGVGEWLGTRLGVPVLAVRVLNDRQLALAGWLDGNETGRYLSDPSAEPGADKEILGEPLGAGNADAFAEAGGHPEAGEELAGVLAEELDPDSVIESERLARVLRLLGLPTWVVAAATLPRPIPTGPGPRELTRLGAGVPGLPGLAIGRAARAFRRRLPPPIVTDVPRGAAGMDPWLY